MHDSCESCSIISPVLSICIQRGSGGPCHEIYYLITKDTRTFYSFAWKQGPTGYNVVMVKSNVECYIGLDSKVNIYSQDVDRRSWTQLADQMTCRNMSCRFATYVVQHEMRHVVAPHPREPLAETDARR